MHLSRYNPHQDREEFPSCVISSTNWYKACIGYAWRLQGAGEGAKFDPARLKGHADSIIPILQLAQKFSWLSFFSAALVAGCTFAMKIIGPPWVREAIKKVLDEMHSQALAKRDRAEFHDRVTLFKFERFCLRMARSFCSPFGGHLVPFSRSGFITQKPSVVSRAPDDGDCQGVAGSAFSSNVVVIKENLPDVSRTASPSAEEYKKYADETSVSVDWLKKERSTARSLYGIPVRVDGKPWGAIVVDSRQTAIPNSAQVVKSYGLVASVLGQLIKRS